MAKRAKSQERRKHVKQSLIGTYEMVKKFVGKSGGKKLNSSVEEGRSWDPRCAQDKQVSER